MLLNFSFAADSTAPARLRDLLSPEAPAASLPALEIFGAIGTLLRNV
jgi:hypothetical protein